VATFADLELTFQNLMHNSDGVFFEVYEERLIEAEAAGESESLVAWGEQLHARRRDAWPGLLLGDPYPMTVRLEVAAGDEVVTYANATRCDENPGAVGRIVVRP
jgi:hypothetical protein